MRASIIGLSLVELLTAISVVGILTMLAIPRYQQFMVMSRRGEAKSNLSHIISLQETYRIDYFRYYSGGAMTGTNGIGYKDGLGNLRHHTCDPNADVDEGLCNYLGFHPDAVDELRYLYQVRGGGSAAVASAASDDPRWIYPDCSGQGPTECGYPSGDALLARVKSSKAVVCRNITKHCPPGAGGVGGTPPIVYSPPISTPRTCIRATQCCPNGEWGAPVTSCGRGGGWTFDVTKHDDDCCVCNVTCPPNHHLTSACQCEADVTGVLKRCDIPTQCCPNGENDNPVTACSKEDGISGWEFDDTKDTEDCCNCDSSGRIPCVKGEEWSDSACDCQQCAPCPNAMVFTTQGTCDCACPKTEQEQCEDSGYTWGASCDCGHSNYTWTPSGDGCNYRCACNVPVVRAGCAANETFDLTTCDCHSGNCLSPPDCCRNGRKMRPSDCGPNQQLKDYPACCTTIATTANIRTLRVACILTDAQAIFGYARNRHFEAIGDKCVASYGVDVNDIRSMTRNLTDAIALAAECAMGVGGKVASIIKMYECLQDISDGTTQTVTITGITNPNITKGEAQNRMSYIGGTGCDITGNNAQINAEPNKCIIDMP